MTAHISLVNIVSFAMQVTVIVAAGALLLRVFRIDAPGAILAYWRTLLVACLMLPLGQPWNKVTLPATTTAVAMVSSALPTTGVTAATQPVPRGWQGGELLLLVLAAGIAARVLWLAIGAYGLWRLRRRSRPLDPLPDGISRAQARVGVGAGFYVSDQVSGPITFGVIRPAVVLPPALCEMPPHVQEAIACHELLHVRRRDWLHEIFEESVVAVLWFHPAVWLLIGRIRLAREQVVDEATIQLTDSRERYVESLLAVARARLFPSFSPASPFLRRHLLKKRVARILQESTMTTRKLIASLTASAAALALAATFAVRSFPLEAQGRTATTSGEPIQLVQGGEHLLHGARPEYPRRAIEQKVEGDVQVEMTINERGEVSDARVLSGPEELRKATLESVLQWHYSPAALASTVTQATLRFQVPPGGFEEEKKKEVEELEISLHKFEPARLAEHRLQEIEAALADPATTTHQRDELKMMAAKIRAEREASFESPDGKTYTFAFTANPKVEKFEGSPRLVQVRTERVSAETAKEVMSQAGVSVGDQITEETAKRIAQVAATIDEHLQVEYEKDKGGILMTILTK
jgi:bla regulator protein blaR1